MAAPQVAATALFLWSVAPLLSTEAVVARLRATARAGVPQTDSACSTIPSATAPALDAYAAILSADQGLAAPVVRRTLLDVVDAAGTGGPDSRFDEQDVIRFLDELDTRAGNTFDYSRFDLNGDGRTGGDTLSRFDLDANVLPAWTSVSQTIEGSPVTFDETRLTDLRVLCFYAYSALYVGDPAVRTSLLDSRCRSAVASQMTMHFVNMSTEIGFTGTQTEQFTRPDFTTEFVTPFEPIVDRNAAGSTGTISLDAQIEADDVNANANGSGFAGANLRWSASCRAERNAIGNGAALAGSAYVAELRFSVSDPNATVRLLGVLPPAVEFDNTGIGEVSLRRGGTVVALTTNTGPTTMSFDHEASGSGSYQFIIRGKARCLAFNPSQVDTRNASLSVSLRVVGGP